MPRSDLGLEDIDASVEALIANLLPGEAQELLIAVTARTASIVGAALEIDVCMPPVRYELFVRRAAGVAWSWQESFTQLGVLTDMLDLGWDAPCVHLEFDPFDVVCTTAPNRTSAVSIAIEAKRRETGRHGLDAMLAVFRELNGSGRPAAVGQSVRTNAQRKYEGLKRLRPAWFVGAAPNVRRSFEVLYPSTGEVGLLSADTLPAPPSSRSSP